MSSRERRDVAAPGVEALAGVEAFRDLPPEALARLAEGARRCVYAPGSVLMCQGDPADCVHVIVRGRVRVEQAMPALQVEPVLLGELGPGEVVGEMGVLDDGQRSATVTAQEETETLALGADLLAAVLVQYPRVSAALLRLMSRRLRSTNELVQRLLEKRRDWLGPW